MAAENTEIFRIRRNLDDAGCPKEVIESFLRLAQEGRTEEQLRLLHNHRAGLLDCVHAEHKKIDCLDFLVFTMQKQMKSVPQRKGNI